MEQSAPLAVLVQSYAAKALACQLLKPLLGIGEAICIARIECMSCVTAAIHYDLNSHGNAPLVGMRCHINVKVQPAFLGIQLCQG